MKGELSNDTAKEPKSFKWPMQWNKNGVQKFWEKYNSCKDNGRIIYW